MCLGSTVICILNESLAALDHWRARNFLLASRAFGSTPTNGSSGVVERGELAFDEFRRTAQLGIINRMAVALYFANPNILRIHSAAGSAPTRPLRERIAAGSVTGISAAGKYTCCILSRLSSCGVASLSLHAS